MQTACAFLPRVARNGRPSLRPRPRRRAAPALTAGTACPRRTQTAPQEPVAGGGRGVRALCPEDRDFRTAARDAYQGRAPPPVVVDRAGRIAVTLARGATVGDLRDALQARARPTPSPRPPRTNWTHLVPPLVLSGHISSRGTRSLPLSGAGTAAGIDSDPRGAPGARAHGRRQRLYKHPRLRLAHRRPVPPRPAPPRPASARRGPARGVRRA